MKSEYQSNLIKKIICFFQKLNPKRIISWVRGKIDDFYLGLDPKKRLSINRLKFGFIGQNVILIIFFAISLIFLFLLSIYIIETITFLSDLNDILWKKDLWVPILLAFQTIFFFFQTINIRRQAKYSRTPNLPIIQAFILKSSKNDNFKIYVKNNGMEAKNVTYSINNSFTDNISMVDKSNFCFDLPMGSEKAIITLDMNEYFNKILVIRLNYEDIFNKGLRTIYIKNPKSLSLENIMHNASI